MSAGSSVPVPAGPDRLIREAAMATATHDLPELNEERRKELVKVAHRYAETARVAVRHVRRDGLDILKKLEKDHKISKDDHDRDADQVQKTTDQAIAEIDHALAVKEKEILTV